MSNKGKVPNIRVVRHQGKDVQIPDRFHARDSLVALATQVQHEEQTVAFKETIKALPLDGARAMYRALQEKFGTVKSERSGFFGEKPPQELRVKTGPNTFESVPWGSFQIAPLDNGTVEFGTEEQSDGTHQFQVSFEVKRLFEPEIREALEMAKTILKQDSIYRGKAISCRFKGNDGTILPLPELEFLDVHEDVPLIFDQEVERDFREQVLWSVTEYGKPGVPDAPSGVALAGAPGVGKSQAMRYLATHAISNGHWTVFDCEDVRDLPVAIRLARQYQPAIVIGEDIEQAAKKERDEATNDLLNTLDGVRSKGSKVMTVITTNHYNKLPEPLLRTGRFDVTFFLTQPQTPDAMERLLREYADGTVPEKEDLGEPAQRLVDLKLIPSDVAAIVQRALRSASFREGGRIKELLAEDFGPAISALERERASKLEYMHVDHTPTEGEHIKAGLQSIGNALQEGIDMRREAMDEANFDGLGLNHELSDGEAAKLAPPSKN